MGEGGGATKERGVDLLTGFSTKLIVSVRRRPVSVIEGRIRWEGGRGGRGGTPQCTVHRSAQYTAVHSTQQYTAHLSAKYTAVHSTP